MKTANPMKFGLTKRRSNSLRCLDCGSGSIHRFTVNTNEETMTTSGILAGLFSATMSTSLRSARLRDPCVMSRLFEDMSRKLNQFSKFRDFRRIGGRWLAKSFTRYDQFLRSAGTRVIPSVKEGIFCLKNY